MVSGCATDEWIHARSVCTANYTQEMLPNYQSITVNKTRAVWVPDGRVTCNTVKHGQSETTNCIQGTRLEYVPYIEVETSDLNKARRYAAIRSCADTTCYSQYGDIDCERGK